MEVVEDFGVLVVSGGDERLDILENGNNKYHINPLNYEGLFSRGSCTCSTLNPLTIKVLDKALDYSTPLGIVNIREKQAQRLKNLLNYEGEDAFELIFAPSGSDLAYLPILFSKILYPEKDIQVLLTCPEELGSGSQMAYQGTYYANKNQFGEQIVKGEELNHLYQINSSRFVARDDEGLINKHSDNIERIIKAYPEKSKIGALVIGSKSGIEDDISLIPNIDKDVLWVVDLCQFRNSKQLVNQLLGLGCMVMLTGSKFYMAPPFCGVMLIPKKLAKRLNNAEVNPAIFNGFDKIFSRYDFADNLSNLSKHLRNIVNPGLALRWEIALDEMERFSRIPVKDSQNLIDEWNQTIKQYIGESQHLELMPHQEKTNQSIISFRVKSRDGRYLSYNELKIFYKEVTADEYSIGKYKKIIFGQPVKYSMGAFIRVAIGAYNIYNLLQKDETTRFDNDKILMSILDDEASTITI